MEKHQVLDSCFENLPKLVDDLDFYLKAYQAYAEFSGRKVEMYQTWAKTIFEDQVVAQLVSNFTNGNILRVLAIGSGDGKIDVCMLEQLVARYPRIQYTVVEPAKEPTAEFKALIEERRPQFDGVEFVWRNETFDEFRKREETKEGLVAEYFHLIHAVHSLYYADDLRQAEDYLKSRLVKEGALLVILLSDEAGIYRVWDRYPKLVEGSPSHNLCSAHLRAIYDASPTPYKFYRQSWPSDISPCFDPASVKGNGMLDFISHVKSFRQSAPEQLKTDLLGFLKMLNRADKDDENTTGGYQRDWDSIVTIKT